MGTRGLVALNPPTEARAAPEGAPPPAALSATLLGLGPQRALAQRVLPRAQQQRLQPRLRPGAGIPRLRTARPFPRLTQADRHEGPWGWRPEGQQPEGRAEAGAG